MKNVKLLLMAIVLIASNVLLAQQGVSINNDGSAADGSAMLDVSSTTKGMLMPRMTEAQKDAISSPATGLMIYQTDGNAGFYYFDGTGWDTIEGLAPITHAVGDWALGGIVFWVDGTGSHGLVCDVKDAPNHITWSAGTDIITHAKGDGPFSGKSNTTLIIAAQGNGDGTLYAARYCHELTVTVDGKTYGDWYLPSSNEMTQMHNNKSLINTIAAQHGGSDIEGNFFWCSTESNQTHAYQIYMGASGQITTAEKHWVRGVRAVRSF